MLDFNNAEPQSSGTGAIPPDSCVILQMTIRTPRAGKEGSHPLLCRAQSGNEYLDVEFKVVRGQFEGREFWQNYTVAGSEKASQISMRTLRAIIESSRGINPKDESPAAVQNRRLNDWTDFQGMQFMAKIGAKCEKNIKDGRWYVNNDIKRVITPDAEEYAIIAQAGEIITNNPLPEAPPESGAAPAAGGAQRQWGAPQMGKHEGSAPTVGVNSQPSAPAQSATSPSSGGAPVPAWAR